MHAQMHDALFRGYLVFKEIYNTGFSPEGVSLNSLHRCRAETAGG